MAELHAALSPSIFNNLSSLRSLKAVQEGSCLCEFLAGFCFILFSLNAWRAAGARAA